ncbi:MAG TPA: TolC family outer membrane protein [Caulobacteraceae bacterium]|nr:TolC family outer membrane protein [Caulobacteraceae bacterium]
MSNSRRALLTAAALGLALSGGANASAETLAEAIGLAYQTNPTLQQQRAQQRALDESVVQARVGYRPQVSVTGSVQYQDPVNGGLFNPDPDNFTATAGVGASQPLYTGGRVTRGVQAAEADVLRGRENLRAVEAQVLAGVIQAYVDVRRDQEALRIRQENVQVLQRQLEEASARFEVGEITRTDVAQAEARLAASQANLSAAQAQLSVSRAAYAAVVGQTPGTLEPEPALPGMPGSFDQAMDVAQDENPTLRASEFAEAAARARVAQARAEYRPELSLRANYGATTTFQADNGPSGRFTDQDAASATANVSVPLFTGGLNGSRVRQALENNNAALVAVEGARREVLQRVSQAWAQVISARAALTANEEQVRAARIAAEGVRQEAQVGLRTTLDVLNAESELREAELNLVRTRRDQYVAQANLLSAMGRLEAEHLVADVEAYDPARNFNRVKNKGWVPWEPLVAGVDRVAAPPVRQPKPDLDAPIDADLAKDTTPRR